MKILKKITSHTSIKTRMIFSLTVILVSAFFITNYLNYRTSHLSVRDNLVNSVLPLTRDNIYSEIQTNIIRPIFISSLMANDTFLKDWAINGEKDVVRIKKYLKAIKEKYDFFSVFFVSEKTKRYYHYDGVLKKISEKNKHDQWYFSFIKMNREYDLDVDTNEASSNMLTVFINHRLTDYRGSLLGVTGVGLNMDRISSMLSSYNKIYGSNIYLVDRTGVIQLHSDKTFIEKINIMTLPGLDRLAGKILSETENSSMYQFERAGSNILLTTRFIPEFDWFLFVEIDEKPRMESILINTKTNIVLGIIISILIISVAVAAVNIFQTQIIRMAVTDELTGLPNRKEFDVQSRKAVYAFHRSGIPFSIIIFDIDHFKKINDEFGHAAGDMVIKEIAAIAMKSKRLTDILVRWGGDEFIILSYGDPDEVLVAAERLKKLVAEKTFTLSNPAKAKVSFNVTISCGVSAFTESDSIDSVISRADTALYSAKSKGRNRVETEPSAKQRKK